MRYLTATLLLLLIVINPLLSASGEARASEPGEFSEWAMSQSAAIDRDWQKAMGRSSASVTAGQYVRTGISSSSYSISGKRIRYQKRNGWNGQINASGYIHPSISGTFLPQTSRLRNGASRGTGMITSPSKVLRGGNRRMPFNSMNFSRNTGISRGTERMHPDFGSRISSSSRKSRSYSTGSLGSSRSRKRR
ncbi:MAG: hypothetical protein JW814_01365 [Candidatus Krumholzibacteriota bacterium]|nr:hypothetical protein [Candidatus Krumholzibacteriota bacterium]